MLVLSRKKGDGVVINNDITVSVVEIRQDKVRLGIVAPAHVPVHRQEVFNAIHGNTASSHPGPRVDSRSTEAFAMMTVPAGLPAIRVMLLAYQANQPLLLIGAHGIGKSALLARAARALRVQFLTRDLSLMEPPDLIGLPVKDHDGRTHYATPAFLPRDGRGLLIFEELNRSPHYMQGPCLQLLTERTLGDYSLPTGWLPCAAINEGDLYQVEELDAALRSRFMQLRLVPDASEWSRWGRKRIHSKVLSFIDRTPNVFEDPASNPRAWTYVSRVLRRWEKAKLPQEVLLTAVAGLVDQTWAVAFLQHYVGDKQPLTADQVLVSYAKHSRAFRRWVKKGRLDLITASLEAIKKRLKKGEVAEFVQSDEPSLKNLAAFAGDLPADVRDEFTSWLQNLEIDLAYASSVL
jgi:carbon storage regulator CsrA